LDHEFGSRPLFPKYPTCGIRGFDFKIFSKLKKELKSKHQFQFHGHGQSRPYLKLLIHFWPGDWKQPLAQIESSIIRPPFKTAGKRAKKLRPPSQNEFWRFIIGLILPGGVHGSGGNGLWESREKQLVLLAYASGASPHQMLEDLCRSSPAVLKKSESSSLRHLQMRRVLIQIKTRTTTRGIQSLPLLKI
jgi:hypothetical protein